MNLHKRLSIQPLVIAYSRPMFSICQDLYTIDVEVCFTRNREGCGGCEEEQ